MTSPRTLLPYQATWVADKSPLKIMEKSRRVGISWAEAYDCVMHAAEGLGDVYYQSYSKDMTSSFISDCADWARLLDAGASEVGETIIKDPKGDVHVYSIALASGKEITALTSSPRQFRSKGRPGDIGVVDEAAYVDNLEEVLKAVLAFLMWGGKVRIISSHCGEASPFNQLVGKIRDGKRPGSHHRVTFDDAIADGLYRRICEITGMEWSEDAETEWAADIREFYESAAAEELDCIPSSGGGPWLSWQLIRAAQHAEAGDPTLWQRGQTYIAIDVARYVHNWVLLVLEVVGDVMWVREMIVLRNRTFSEQEKVLDDADRKYRPIRILIDRTGMGLQFTERAQENYGSERVVGIVFSAGSKLDMAIALKQVMQDRRLRTVDDTETANDLYSVKGEPGPSGMRLVTDESETDGHADRFWVHAMAASAAIDGSGPFDGRAAADEQIEQRMRLMDMWAGSKRYVDRSLGVVRSASSIFRRMH